MVARQLKCQLTWQTFQSVDALFISFERQIKFIVLDDRSLTVALLTLYAMFIWFERQIKFKVLDDKSLTVAFLSLYAMFIWFERQIKVNVLDDKSLIVVSLSLCAMFISFERHLKCCMASLAYILTLLYILCTGMKYCWWISSIFWRVSQKTYIEGPILTGRGGGIVKGNVQISLP